MITKQVIQHIKVHLVGCQVLICVVYLLNRMQELTICPSSSADMVCSRDEVGYTTVGVNISNLLFSSPASSNI